MDDRIVVLSGLPLTCNPVKMKLRFESLCNVCIDSIKVENTFAEVKFPSKEECRKFHNNLPPKIKFGNEHHDLAIVDKKPTSTETEMKPVQHHSKAQQVFSRPQTWSSLSNLPSCKCGLLVQPTSKETTPERVRKYFETNVLSCGGPIEAIIPMIDGIFIAFNDEVVAEKVWNSRPHRVNKKAVVVHLKTVPKKHKQQLIVKPHKVEIDEEKLKKLLKQCSEKDLPLKNIVPTSKGLFFVAYEGYAAEKDIQNIVDKFWEKNPMIDISFLLKSDCIYVSNFPSDMSDHEIKMYFENSARSGGGPVTRIDHVEKGGLVIYFSSYKDAGAVCDKSSKKELEVFGRALTIHQYFHNVHERKLERSNQLDDFIKQWVDEKGHQGRTVIFDSRAAVALLNESLDSNMRKFLQCYPEHIALLHDQLLHQATVEISSKGFELSFKSENEALCRDTLRQIEDFLRKYKSERIVVTDETVKQIIENDLGDHGCKDEVYLSWSGPPEETLIVTGMDQKVDSVIKCLPNAQNLYPLKLDKINFRWLIETEALAQLKRDYKAIAGSSQSDVFLFHDHKQFYTAKQAIGELVKKLKSEMFVPEKECFKSFLSDGKSNSRIVENVTEFFKSCKISAILVVSDNSVTILGVPDCIEKALQQLNKELAVDDSFVKRTPGYDASAAAWEKIMKFERDGRIKRIPMGNGVLLVGFREFVFRSRNELARCAENFTEACITMEYKAAKHLFAHEKKCSELCKACEVLFDIDVAGITLRGEKANVEAVSKRLEAFGKDIVKETINIKHPKAGDFLSSEEGIKLLSIAGEAFESTLNVVFKEQPQISSAFSWNGGQNSNLSSGASNRPAPPISMCMGPLKVTIREGDITEETNDVIVNSAHVNFDLSVGAVSRAILKKAGQSIQKEASQYAGHHMCTTSGGDLKCKAIIHVILPNDLKVMKELLTDVFIEAHRQGFVSISIPAIGTGSAKISNCVVAQLMYCSIQDFVKKHPKIKHLKILDIVLFNDVLMADFKEEFLAAQASGEETFHIGSLLKAIAAPFKGFFKSESSAKSRIFGKLTVSVCQGDITEATTDAIVNSTNFKFDLSYGMVSQKILEKGGRDIQQEVYKANVPDIRVTGAGNLNCKKIIHVDSNRDVGKIGQCVIDALEAAERYFCTSISIPAIGTGNVGLSEQAVARIMLKAIEDFERSNPRLNYLTKVNFVIYDEQQMEDFRDAFFGAIPEQTGFSIVNEVDDTGLIVEAYSFNKAKAKEALNQIKGRLEMEFGRPSTADGYGKLSISNGKDLADSRGTFRWMYKDDQAEWQEFNSKDSEQLEKLYQMEPKPQMETLNFNGKKQVINFTWMRLDRTPIHRISLPGYGVRKNGFPSSSNQYPDSIV